MNNLRTKALPGVRRLENYFKFSCLLSRVRPNCLDCHSPSESPRLEGAARISNSERARLGVRRSEILGLRLQFVELGQEVCSAKLIEMDCSEKNPSTVPVSATASLSYHLHQTLGHGWKTMKNLQESLF